MFGLSEFGITSILNPQRYTTLSGLLWAELAPQSPKAPKPQETQSLNPYPPPPSNLATKTHANEFQSPDLTGLDADFKPVSLSVQGSGLN